MKHMILSSVAALMATAILAQDSASFQSFIIAGDGDDDISISDEDFKEEKKVEHPRVIQAALTTFATIPDDDLPDQFSLNQGISSFGFGSPEIGKGGFSATYLVLANDIVEIEDVEITSIADKDGNDLRKAEDGSDAWSVNLGSGAWRAPFRGRCTSGFSVIGTEDVAGKEPIAISGVAKVRVSEGTKTQKAAAKISDGSVKVGGLTFRLSLKAQKTFSIPKGTKDVVLAVDVTDPEDILKSVKVSENGKRLSSQGMSSVNAKRTYQFKKPEGDEIELTVTTTAGTKILPLSF